MTFIAIRRVWFLLVPIFPMSCPSYHTEAIAGFCETSLQWLYNKPEPKLPVKYARKIGNQPKAEENPFNAW